MIVKIELDDSALDFTIAKLEKLTRTIEYTERLLKNKIQTLDNGAIDSFQAKADKLLATIEAIAECVDTLREEVNHGTTNSRQD